VSEDPHQHSWQRSAQWAGRACSYCDMSYWDWSQAELSRLQAEIVAWDERYTGEGRARFECAEHVERLQAENERLRALILNADSMLSLLRHRATIAWGMPGLPDQSEADALIGRLRREERV
jgi:hypothetical protein